MSLIVDFILNNYPQFTKKEIEKLVLKYRDTILGFSGKDGINAIAIYLRVNDETLNKIESGEIDLTNPEDMNFCYRQKGKNIHFFMCASKDIKFILRGIRMIKHKENPKTISWFSPDMKQFFIRRTLCHQ